MKRLVVICFSTLLIGICNIKTGATLNPVHTTVVADSVYICSSTTSYAYHNSIKCKGLNRCTHKIIKVSLKEAVEKYKKQACRICQ